jgi:hypothetical protein
MARSTWHCSLADAAKARIISAPTPKSSEGRIIYHLTAARTFAHIEKINAD